LFENFSEVPSFPEQNQLQLGYLIAIGSNENNELHKFYRETRGISDSFPFKLHLLLGDLE
jgi:hypothetical protein